VAESQENQKTEDGKVEVEKEAPKFDWVTARSSCSLPKVFHTLELQVEEDVKARNALRLPNAPYEFSFAPNGDDFVVTLVSKDVRMSVTFRRAGHAILILDDKGNTMFEVTLTFSADGYCKLHVDQEEREFWQVRRMALEELMFRGY